jgi:DNA-binding MarR family transcriptional regulator
MQQSLAGVLHELVGLLDRSGEAILRRETGISYRQFYLVSAIARLGPATQRELAGFVGHSDAAISRMVVTLEAAGLVTARMDPGNRRRNTVSLTVKGAVLEEQAAALLDRQLSDLLTQFHVNEPVLLAETVKMKDALRSVGWAPPKHGQPDEVAT